MGTKRVGVLVCVLLCGMLGSAAASPMFGIHSLQDWQEALGGGGGGGRIEPVKPAEFDKMVNLRGPYDGMQLEQGDGWPVEYQEALFSEPLLTAEMHTDSQGTTEAGLVMTWGQDLTPQDDQQVAAAWDFVYDEDPDLSDMTLEFSIHTPGPCMFFSLNIVDVNDNYREWIWHSGDDPRELRPCTWTTVTVDPVNITSTSTNFALVPGAPFTYSKPDILFDLTQVKLLRFNENGIWANPDHMDPTGSWIWNAWDHVEVHPEPATMILLGSGLLALARKRRKK